MRNKMNTKIILVSLLAIVSVLSLIATVSAVDDVLKIQEVRFDGVLAYAKFWDESHAQTAGLTAGETVEVQVKLYFFPGANDSRDVVLTFELGDTIVEKNLGIVKAGSGRELTFDIEVPSDFDKNKVENMLNVEVTVEGESVITGDDFEVELPVKVSVPVTRPGYDVDIKSLTTLQAVSAGQMIPVDVVLKNSGYNELDDLYISASIAELGTEKTSYFGDLVNVAEDCNDDDDCDDTVSGRIFLQTPSNAKPGIYTIDVKVYNDDMSLSASKQIAIGNEFYGNNVIATSNSKTVGAGENAEFGILIVNPTDSLKVYTIIPEASSDISADVSESIVAIPAGSSKTVTVTANSATEGKYTVNVKVLSGTEVVGNVALSSTVEGKSLTSNPIVVLTIVLAIIFLVLLIVLFVLIGKKPAKSEEFGESYY